MIEKLIGLMVAKRQTEPDKWVESTVTSTDAAASYGRGSVEGEALVRRCQQWVMVCATRNAIECESKPIRLYVPKRGGGKKRSWAKSVTSRTRNDYLRDRSRGPGIKAATYAEYAGDVEEVTDHPILDVLRKPNPWMFGHDFLRKFYLFGELTGNRYTHIVEADGTIQLYPMASQDTRPVPDRDGFLAGYWYGRDSTIQDFFEPDEVYHSQFMPSPVSPYAGIGPLHAVFAEADIDAAATENELAMWRNGARPDWVLGIDPALSANKSYVDQLRAQVNKDHRGVRNRGKFLIAGATEVKPLQFTPREMEYILGKENVEQRIWAAFGVPESEVKLNDSNLASSRSGSSQYLRQTIKPRINGVAEEWTERLLPLFGIEPGEMWFAPDDPVPEDIEARSKQCIGYTNAAILTVNEARAEDGREPIDGGDILRFNGTPLDVLANPPQFAGLGGPPKLGADGKPVVSTSADSAPNPAATGQEGAAASGDVQSTALNGAQVTSLLELTTAVATGQLPEANALALAGAAFPLIPADQVGAIFAGLDKFKPEPSPEQQAKIEAAKNPQPMPISPAGGAAGPGAKTATAPSPSAVRKHAKACGCGICPTWERKDAAPALHTTNPYREARTDFIDALESYFRRVLAPLTPQFASGADTGQVMAGAGFDRGFSDAVTPYVDTLITDGYGKGVAELPKLPGGVSMPAFDVTAPDAAEFLDQYKIRLAREVSATIQDQIQTTVRAGIDGGKLVNEIAADLNDAVPEISQTRARVIAVSESKRAFDQGRIQSWRRSGIVVGMRWLLSGNPCPLCVAISEQFGETTLDAPFVPDGESIDLGDGITVGGSSINWAGLSTETLAHPGCYCSIEPIYATETA